MGEIFGQLDNERKVVMEKFWDDWVIQSAEENRHLYLAGIRDGVRILKMISGI
jgi:hypothetical protein